MLIKEFICLGCRSRVSLKKWWYINKDLASWIGGLGTSYSNPPSFLYKNLLLVPLLILITSSSLIAQEFNSCKLIELESQKYKTYQIFKSLPPISGYDVHSYQLDLQLDPGINYISGSVRIDFKSTVDSLDIFQVLLADSMQVDSVIFHSQSLSFQHSNRVVSSQLPSLIAQNSLDSIRFYYQGSPQPGGLGTFVQDTITAGDTMIWTLSQPYGASEWFPCKDDLYDKADSIEIIVTTPLAYKVATNGLLNHIDSIGNQHRYHYKHNYPIATYLIAIAVGNYQVFQEHYQLGTDSLLIEHYLFQSENLAQSNAPLEAWMQLFDSLFGEYPFINEKYGHASFTRGGGMEHQTMSFMGGYGGELIAHELAHQWFGDKVTCGSWQDLWLNEGFATYLTGLTYEFNSVHDSIYWPVVLGLWKRDAFNYPDQALYREDTSVTELFNPVVYQKGASILHMLRWLVGDSSFFKGVNNYLSDPQLSYGFSKTEDFKRHIEASSKKNLNEFFKDWVYGKGYPTYTTTWSQENNLMKVKIEQLPSEPSVYFFNIPLPYQIHSGSWDSTILLNPRFTGDQFNISVNKNIDSLTFDPEGWILAKSDILTSKSELKNNKIDDLIIYPNPTNSWIEIKGIDKSNSFLIYDLSLKLVKEGVLQNRIDLGELPKGTYILQLINSASQHSIKVEKL